MLKAGVLMSAESVQSCLYLIHSISPSLSEREKRIADFILTDPARAVHLSMEDLALAANVSISSLVRFVKKLGFKGYQQFRIVLASEALAPEARIYEAVVEQGEDPVNLAFSSAQKALQLTASMINPKDLADLAARIVQVQTVYLFGLGGSAVVAKDAMHKLVRTGIQCMNAEDFHLQLMMASQMTPQDVAVVISHTGANKDTLRIAETIKASEAFLALSPPIRARPFLAWPICDLFLHPQAVKLFRKPFRQGLRSLP